MTSNFKAVTEETERKQARKTTGYLGQDEEKVV